MAKNHALLVAEMRKRLPESALFGFNSGIDEVCVFRGKPLPTLPYFAPSIRTCFKTGEQKEMAVRKSQLKELRLLFPPTLLLVGGQAGNACQTASCLGVKSFLHTHCKSPEMLNLFSFPSRIFLASNGQFLPASSAPTLHSTCFRHLVIEFGKTRFIAAHDPHVAVVDWEFSKARYSSPLPLLAYLGGFHLFKSETDVAEAGREITEWKARNPGMRIHVELGEFQKKYVFEATRKVIFPLIDSIGVNEIELKQLRATPQSLLKEVPEVLFHTQKKSIALPSSEESKKALEFAAIVASYRAETGRPPTFDELEKYAATRSSFFISKPKLTVGLGDTFSCAYFLARNALR